jgi:uncharacterized Zn-binding protein involved in type VI secretion
MPAAARVLDATAHPGILSGPGVTTVFIEGLFAAVKDDVHTCALPPPAGPHPPNTIAAGSTTVFIGGRAAARKGDLTGCGAPVVSGALSVFIGG